MPLVTGVQVIGETRLEVWFNPKPSALVGQERTMFGGLATTFNLGAVTVSRRVARTPAASACAPLADGVMVTIQPLGVSALVTLVESVGHTTGDKVLVDVGRHGVGGAR